MEIVGLKRPPAFSHWVRGKGVGSVPLAAIESVPGRVKGPALNSGKMAVDSNMGRFVGVPERGATPTWPSFLPETT